MTGWPDNQSAKRLLAWSWTRADGFTLVVVNLSPEPADGMVHLPGLALAGRRWQLTDLLDGAVYQRDGDDIAAHGMYVARAGWAGHVLTTTSQDR